MYRSTILPSDMPEAVARAYAEYPTRERGALLWARTLVFEAASEDCRIGVLTETLKWGEPAYLTERSRSGGTLRLGLGGPAARPILLVTCTSSLVQEFRDRYSDRLEYLGNRGVFLPPDTAFGRAAIGHCAKLVLTYHVRRANGRASENEAAS